MKVRPGYCGPIGGLRDHQRRLGSIKGEVAHCEQALAMLKADPTPENVANVSHAFEAFERSAAQAPRFNFTRCRNDLLAMMQDAGAQISGRRARFARAPSGASSDFERSLAQGLKLLGQERPAHEVPWRTILGQQRELLPNIDIRKLTRDMDHLPFDVQHQIEVPIREYRGALRSLNGGATPAALERVASAGQVLSQRIKHVHTRADLSARPILESLTKALHAESLAVGMRYTIALKHFGAFESLGRAFRSLHIP